MQKFYERSSQNQILPLKKYAERTVTKKIASLVYFKNISTKNMRESVLPRFYLNFWKSYGHLNLLHTP